MVVSLSRISFDLLITTFETPILPAPPYDIHCVMVGVECGTYVFKRGKNILVLQRLNFTNFAYDLAVHCWFMNPHNFDQCHH